ncbi:MAG: hypothetical protein NNA19_02365 [Nitrospira sp.]|nr:hypothetical protein [Nitrospira sp.]MCP9474077.1 hypothetical protein [Nitrospira sp.]
MSDMREAHAQKHEDIFKVFLHAVSSIGIRVKDIHYTEQQDPDQSRDVVTTMTDGSKVEWQLAEWVDEIQMTTIKRAEREGRDQPYNPLTDHEALKTILRKKSCRYGGLEECDARLIVYYSQGSLYGSPYDGPSNPLDDFAQIAGVWLKELRPPFKNVYLLKVHECRAFEVFPAILPCT